MFNKAMQSGNEKQSRKLKESNGEVIYLCWEF